MTVTYHHNVGKMPELLPALTVHGIQHVSAADVHTHGPMCKLIDLVGPTQ